MPMVITLTFNPCIDKSFDTDILQPDKKLRCTTPRLEPGGGGINVARVITRLGEKALAVYPAGGYHGTLLTEMLAAEGVDTYPVPILDDIRENINVRESTTGHQYRFIEPGPILNEYAWHRCLDAISMVDKGGIVVISGSLPKDAPPDLWRQIKHSTGRRSARLVVDAHGEALRNALNVGVFLIKPSEDELAALARDLGLSASSPTDAAKAIVEKGWAEVVVLSRGAAGATLITRGVEKQLPAPEVPRQSTVGAGDSLVAGIVTALVRNMDLEEAVRFGVACGAATVMHPGTELCNRKDAEAIYAQSQQILSINPPHVNIA